MTLSAVLLPLLGGVLIGIGASLLYFFNGRVAGISGIVAGLVRPKTGDVAWRIAFVFGLLGVGFAMHFADPSQRTNTITWPLWLVMPAGLLVGFGARLGGGCTSGHGVCGVSRLSPRSIAATATFIAVGSVTVWVTRQLCGAPL